MLFRKPPAARRMEILLSVAVTVQCVVGPLVGAVLTGKPFLAVASLPGLGWVLWFLYRVVGPSDLRLDGNQLTYELTRGWPWKPVTRIGPFSDIKGVCLSPNKNAIVLIAKPGTAPERVVVSSPYMSSASSNALVMDGSFIAESRARVGELNRVYGFPIVPYPKKQGRR